MRLNLRLVLLIGAVGSAWAQLPVARVTSIFPPGAQAGASALVTIAGSDLDEPRALRFSHPRISAVLKDGKFTVTAATNVPVGVYDVRVIGKNGASNPRAFTVGNFAEIVGAATNKTFATAQPLPLPCTVNAKSVAAIADYYRVHASKGDRVIVDCAAHLIDSKMDPALLIYDSAGKEIDRARNGGVADVIAAADGDYTIKVYDVQFRGGDDYWYRLSIRKGPWIDFVLPAAVEAGGKSKVTVFGRNLPNKNPSKFPGLEQSEVEVEAPTQAQPSYLARRPADAAVEGFEYRLASSDGVSNPVFIGFATAKPLIESTNNSATNAMAVTPQCEIQAQFYPRRSGDWFQFDAAKNDVYWIEILSQRLGLNTDPFALVQRVSQSDKGGEQLSDVHEMYASDANVGGVEFNTSTRDPAWRFEAKEGGTFRIQTRDLFESATSDPRRIYRLSIRKESPDFALIAYFPAPPPLNKDSKEINSWGGYLRRGDSIPVRILALRRDGFAGDLEVTADELPSGVSAAPLKLSGSATSGLLILSAAENCSGWIGSLNIVGRAKVRENEIKHPARSGSVTWNIADYNNDAVTSQLNHELVLSVSGDEVAPLAIRAASEKPIEGTAGGKISANISIIRRSDFNGAVKFKTLTEPAKEFEVDGKATNAVVELDLAQLKLAAGAHFLPVYATSAGKYRNKDLTATVYTVIPIQVASAPQKTP